MTQARRCGSGAVRSYGRVLVLSLACVTQAIAQDGAPAAGPVMTRDELRLCLGQQDALNARREQLENERSTLEVDRNTLSDEQAELARDKAALPANDGGAVQAYNDQSRALDLRVVAWNARSADFAERAHSLDVERQAWGGRCASRRFRADDEAAVRSGR